jgi:hypothetical protein
MHQGDYWFKPKTHGYGATPTSWKGWAATFGFVVVMIAWSLFVFGLHKRASIPISEWVTWALGCTAMVVAFTALARRKTEGDWKWRWGGRDKME